MAVRRSSARVAAGRLILWNLGNPPVRGQVIRYADPARVTRR
ncbi:hypothetical protein [Pararhodobacter oceanensis]|nr:hypothetical protein [Pararhodobacter oceanensis]